MTRLPNRRPDGMLRRCDRTLMHQFEIELLELVYKLETAEFPASVLETEIVVMLGACRDKLADYLESSVFPEV